MANVTKSSINDDIARLMARANSDGEAITVIVDYVWDLWNTQAGDTAPVTAEAQAQQDAAVTEAAPLPQE